MSKIKFNRIQSDKIFGRDFEIFTTNNIIEFSNKESQIAVLYGPNGTGKTSLVNTLNGKGNTYFELEYDNQTYTKNDDLFYIIKDQNNRNIIKGEAKDFIIGDNVKKEYELKEMLDKKYDAVKKNILESLKNKFKISKKTSPLIKISPPALIKILEDFANNQSKGSETSVEQLTDAISKLDFQDTLYEEERLEYFMNEYNLPKSIMNEVLLLDDPEIKQHKNIVQVEENTEALKILEKFKHKDDCVVCDTENINTENLIENKTKNRETIIQALPNELSETLHKLITDNNFSDPFKIKEHILKSLELGDVKIIINLQTEIEDYKKVFSDKLSKFFIDLPLIEELKNINSEYQKLIESKPEITDEDFLYIEDVITNSMQKELSIARDENKNLKIYLKNDSINEEFLDQDRNSLPLSTGEQNFLSLSFEILKAKKSSSKIIVMDDPISSFDSIYKNKVVYSILKFLVGKKQIILTHNLDLVRLMEAQYPKSFKFYLFNNVTDETNGFIDLNDKEFKMLLYLDELLLSFKNDVLKEVKDIELYLMSLIPFMRGYSKIKDIGNKSTFNTLTNLMHGYKTEEVDLIPIYNELFDPSDKTILPLSYKISVKDILNKKIENIDIIDPTKYPLLDKTLRHSLTYLTIRLEVEKDLIDVFDIVVDENKDQLGKIIDKAFPREPYDYDKAKYRVSLTSKKTLINEFNHFEGNLSIFQPAMDISDKSLDNEKSSIYLILKQIKKQYSE